MKLSISNIGWEAENDDAVYKLMKKHGYSGLEIAPTRLFPENPYYQSGKAKEWAEGIKAKYGLVVSSMQSIWFGRQEKIFGTKEERKFLLDYTKKATDFAECIGCSNLVFGCPKNRNLPENAKEETAIAFFRELGDYAVRHNMVISMEANPTIYNTNYINDTFSAVQLIEKVGSAGFKLNLDVGTMVCNSEGISDLAGKVKLISHVHISEPGLALIEKRNLHKELRDVLTTEKYQGFVSVEMGKRENLRDIEAAICYIREVFD